MATSAVMVITCQPMCVLHSRPVGEGAEVQEMHGC